ncbi:hypothetical protein RYR54_003507 [Aeromonas sobria]|jgi:PTS system N-acetylgalactosamine-specific IIA component|nr:hypothetical protein [Aeromonas sobria]
MLGIIITGHGGFVSGLAKAMEQILGEQPYVAAIDFPESSTTSKLEHQLAETMSVVEQGDGLSVREFRVRGLTSLADEMQKDRQAEASLVEEGI